jgi:hypothetical protein
MAERKNEKEIEKEIFNLSSSESEEEEGREPDMPPPDQEPPKLPDLEVIRNLHSLVLVGLVHPNLKTHGETREQIVHRESKDERKSTGTESRGYQN